MTGVGFVGYTFLKAWVPGFEEDLNREVALDDLAPGQWKVVHWLGRNVFVQRRTEAMLDHLAQAAAPLKDPVSNDSSQPAFARNRFRSLAPEIFVAFNNCTHLGCEVVAVDDRGIGFKCPCHQSDYDFAGRVFEGAAAPLNLAVPSYRFISGNTLVLEADA